jgi:shikimate kinase
MAEKQTEISNRKVYLIGFMGSGKTTAGMLLARSLRLPFIDTDTVIEEEDGVPISELFRVKGERYFRAREKQVLRRITGEHGSSGFVMSTGGGMPCGPGNLSYMKNNGTVVYLKTTVDDILKRVKDTGKRPIFHRFEREKKPREAIRALLEKRERYYSKAHIVVSNYGDNAVSEIAGQIEQALGRKDHGID